MFYIIISKSKQIIWWTISRFSKSTVSQKNREAVSMIILLQINRDKLFPLLLSNIYASDSFWSTNRTNCLMIDTSPLTAHGDTCPRDNLSCANYNLHIQRNRDFYCKHNWTKDNCKRACGLCTGRIYFTSN